MIVVDWPLPLRPWCSKAFSFTDCVESAQIQYDLPISKPERAQALAQPVVPVPTDSGSVSRSCTGRQRPSRGIARARIGMPYSGKQLIRLPSTRRCGSDASVSHCIRVGANW